MGSSYLDILALDILHAADPSAAAGDVDLSLYRLYALLLLAKGSAVTERDVHNAWAAWASEHEPGNPNLRPFAELAPAVQNKDKPYTDAIRRVAENIPVDK